MSQFVTLQHVGANWLQSGLGTLKKWKDPARAAHIAGIVQMCNKLKQLELIELIELNDWGEFKSSAGWIAGRNTSCNNRASEQPARGCIYQNSKWYKSVFITILLLEFLINNILSQPNPIECRRRLIYVDVISCSLN